MATHKFSVGQMVEMMPEHAFSPRGVFEVVRLLPPRDGEFQYRIKSVDEPHERVVKENRRQRVARTVLCPFDKPDNNGAPPRRP